MTTSRRLVLIDGSALAYRSYFAFIRAPLMSSKGENTSAAFGFANSLLRVLREIQPDYLAIAFDTSVPTFRHEVYPEYKSTRAKMPPELSESLPRIDELVAAMNVTVLRRDGIEADDIIGTVARLAAGRGLHVDIYSGDKDFCQLVDDRIHVIRPKPKDGDEHLDREGVIERMGVPPERVVDLLALMGDASDHIPGVPGVGEKTALKLIRDHGSLEDVLGNASAVPGKLGERLKEHEASARLSKDLVTIRTDVEFEVDVDSLRLRDPDRPRLLGLFRELEFAKLIEQFSESEAPATTSYLRVRSLEELEDLVHRMKDAEIVSFDTETTSKIHLDARLVGFSFSMKEGEAFYVPVGHSALGDGEGANLPLDEALAHLRPVLEDPDVPKVGQHVKYDRSVLLNHGVDVKGVDFDTMLAAYLLDPGLGRYGLDDLAMRELGHKMIAYTDVAGEGKNQRDMWQVEVDRVTPYACEDADVTLRLRNRFAPRLRENRLQHLFEDVEMPLSDVLLHMERRGVVLDVELFAALAKELTQEIHSLEKEIHRLAGHPFNVSSQPQLRKVLFEELELPAGRRTKTGSSTDSDVLETIADKHPIAAKILDYRQATKLLSTYVDALPRLIRADTGRLHTSFNQTVAATGRLSSSDPNLQNIPVRTPTGRRIREGFIAPPGFTFVSADYNQVELRVLASISGDPGLIEAFRQRVDVHRHTAATVFGVFPETVTPEMRARAKAVNFGVMYGQGARGLAQSLKIPIKEAQSFIDAYFERYSAVRRFKTETLDRARRDGYVTTLLGRRRFIPEIASEQAQHRAYAERTAVNTVIQGTAADLIKIAMVRIHRRLQTGKLRAAMLLQVHDELLFEAPEDDVGALTAMVREEMEGALELEVPLVVDVGAGANWLEAH